MTRFVHVPFFVEDYIERFKKAEDELNSLSNYTCSFIMSTSCEDLIETLKPGDRWMALRSVALEDPDRMLSVGRFPPEKCQWVVWAKSYIRATYAWMMTAKPDEQKPYILVPEPSNDSDDAECCDMDHGTD